VNAVAEIRFQTSVPATLVAGMIYSAVRERFPQQTELPQAQMPDEMRAVNPALRYLPTVALNAKPLSLYVGPRVLFLGMSGTEYPGWSVYREMLEWVVERVRNLGVVKNPERVGLRYVDFFEPPISKRLQVDLLLGGKSQASETFQFACHVQRENFACIIQANSSAVFETPKGPRHGCTLDVDFGFTADPARFWDTVVSELDRAHKLQKQMFFVELLEPSFLATLKPEYD
jgi:uncharacterized protein (TIGR04255 family)